MANIAVGTEVQTEEFLADEKVVDMDPTMRLLDPDQTQFDTLTRRLDSRAATREKVNWLEETLLDRVTTVTAAGYASGATSIPVTPGTGLTVAQVGDLFRNMRSGEMVQVTALAANDLTVAAVRIGSAPAAAGLVNDKLLNIGPALPQGSFVPPPRWTQRVLGFNYTQIVRTSYEFSGTAAEIELYGNSVAKEAARKAVEHKRTWENIGFFGGRSFTTAGAGATATSTGTCGGALEFIQTNRQTVAGELTADFLDLFLTTVLAKGTSDKVIFTGTIGAYYISRFNRSGQGAFWAPSNERVHGVKVDGFISGVFGTQVPIIVKKEWADYPSGPGGYNGYIFVLDMGQIERRPLRNRDTKKIEYDKKSYGNGKDAVGGEYFTEASLTFANEKAHGLLVGVA